MNEILEAKRHLSNAREILREKAGKEDGLYKDRKYVKMAGHTAYTGILVALDGLLGDKRKGRKSVDWYKDELSSRDKKMLSKFVTAYDILHLSMSYDGNLSAVVSKEGLDLADQIISWVEQKAHA